MDDRYKMRKKTCKLKYLKGQLLIYKSFQNAKQIMSIGFSVDLSAHITYAFVKAPNGLSSDERAIAALETLGWPVFLVSIQYKI